ncbi:putative metalloprotease with PDZ domain [Gelidibacter sediminis]|uniref:Putative metalloprotease with PDZ domain n=1 Tax=Gelidibacter sediminis TaxID=1608710 RepID=A0A4R7Q7T8_9FLAO|nr:PDZ domain-containing protein [Gelidibacter sediminis]TDU43707.1 putative metalloprotease with PDZ domain [Gelidibacter sediminis]
MIRSSICLLFFMASFVLQAQISSKYTISFKKAVHHEANIQATFSNLKSETATFRMSRSSPGRYALHEFAKNVYNVKVTNGKGKELKATRPDPYSWEVNDHDGTIHVSYTLFANHGDGTYAQVDETHAHLNIPATFMYVPELEDQEMEVTFKVREDLNWKIATQLKHQQNNTYYAPNLQYFMDSPVEIANFRERSFDVKGQKIMLVMHDDAASEDEVDTYFEKVSKVVLEQMMVFGELPSFDYGEYLFLACYMPNATGDGMEHRNSTAIPSSRSLSQGGMEGNIGTVAHEFFHCWNVERIRPKSLEPFDFSQANMSGELWFAEGFTSYYDDLSLVRSGIMSREDYIDGLVRTFNYVWTSPGRQFFNPIEMSYQAPFVDAAKSVDETNRENTFISYYSYGSMLGLALDLSLREQNLTLDQFMTLVWNTYGKSEVGYTVNDLHESLVKFAGKQFADDYFGNYIYKSGMPDFERLLKNVGVILETKNDIEFGTMVRNQVLVSNPKIGSASYSAGFQKGDKLLKIGGIELDGNAGVNSVLNGFKIGEKVSVVVERYGNQKELELTIGIGTSYNMKLMDANLKAFTKKLKERQASWLASKV